MSPALRDALDAMGVRLAPPLPPFTPAELAAVQHGVSMGWKPTTPGEEPPF